MLKQMRAHPPHFGAAGTVRCRGHRCDSGGAAGTRRGSVPPTRGQPPPPLHAWEALRPRPVRTDRAAGPPAPLPAPCRPAPPLLAAETRGGRAASLRVAFPDLASTVAEVGKPWPYTPRAAGTLRRGRAERRSTPGSLLGAAESVGL